MGKKSISLTVILVLVVVLSGIVSAGTYGGGGGTEIDPYLIADANHIQEMRDDSNDWDKYFLLTADVNLAGKGDNPDGSFSTAVIAPEGTIAFTGIFDGNDSKITNLTINANEAGSYYLGLFGRIYSNGQVMNLNMKDVNITGGDSSIEPGGLCGVNSGTITNCYVSGNIDVGDNSKFIGGLCGGNYEGTIIDCYTTVNIISSTSSRLIGSLCGKNFGTISNSYATGSVTGGNDSQYFGGLCGSNSGGIIFNCYAISNVTGGDNSVCLGGLCGYSDSGIISHSYATGSVTGGDNSDYLGGLCGESGVNGTISHCYSIGSVAGGNNSLNLGGLCGWNNSSIFNCFWDVNKSGQVTSAGGTGLTTVQMKQQSNFIGWDFLGETANGTSDFWIIEPDQYPELTALSDSFSLYIFSGGIGTELDPYQVCSTQDLGAIWQYPQACFVLTNDIDLAGIEWFQAVIPIFSTFDGKFNGNSFRILNLSMFSGNYLGLFAKIGLGGEVKNLVIGNATITSGDDSEYLGGLCGENCGTISYCYTTGNVTGGNNSYFLGGLCGDNHGTVTDCHATCSMTGGDNSGYIGGLCGSNAGTISNSYAIGNIQGGNYIGGLCGSNYHGTISNCYAIGSVISGDNYRSLGGLCGRNSYDSRISDCYATGSVTSGNNSIEIGGLCGSNYYSTISNSYAKGSVSGGNNSKILGGLCGDNFWGTISNSYAKGGVIGGDYSNNLGGFCGRNENSTISKSYATGEVFADGISWQSYHFYHYYSPFNFDKVVINGISYRCLANHTSSSSFENDLAAGYWMPTTGGLVGKNSSNVGYSFWDVNTSGLNVSDGGVGVTTSQMQTESTFTDASWDFSTPVWEICDGTNYPKLAWQVPLPGDFVCPDGVEVNDLGVFVEQWLFDKLSADDGPDGGDGFVDFFDWAVFAAAWQSISEPPSANWNSECDIGPGGGDGVIDGDDLAVFVGQWLGVSAYCADIAPAADGDGTVNMLDFAILANNWLAGVE